MINTLSSHINPIWNSCTKNQLICGAISIVFLIPLLIFVFYFVKTLIPLCKGIKRLVANFINNYGEDKLSLRTKKRLGDYNFLKLLYFQYIEQKLTSPLSQIYYPSIPSLLAVIVIFMILFFLPGKELLKYKIANDSNNYQNLIAIHAGIGAIILAFLILVAETSEFGKQHNKARLILRETWLFPLATLEILSLFIFALGNNNLGSILSIFVVGLLTINAIFKVTALFINRYILQEKERDIVNDRFSLSLDQAVSDRLATTTLFEYFEQSKYSLDYSFSQLSKENRKSFSLTKKGVISDIYLGRLDKLLGFIENIANTKNLSIKKNLTIDKQARKVSNSISSSTNETYQSAKVSMLQLVGSSLYEDNKEILSISKSLYDIADLRIKIEKEINNIFIVKPQDTIEKEIRLELDETKDKASEAITSNKVGILNSAMETYESLIYKILVVFEKYGGGYSSDAARKERSSLFGGWPFIKWIRDDLYDVLNETIKSEKENLIREVTYAPTRIIFSAFNKRDHLIFQEFIYFQSYLYLASREIESPKLKKYLIDRSSRYLVEFVDYRILPQLEDSDTSLNDISHMRDFAFEIFQTYKYLLKYAFDNRDVDSFSRYSIDFNHLLYRFNPVEEYRKEELEFQLKAANTSDDRKKEIEDKLQRASQLEDIEIQIKNKKIELFMGMAAWCLDKLKLSEFKDDALLSIWGKLSSYLPSEINRLISIYETVHSHRTQTFWGWDWWELEEKRGDSDGVITTEITIDAKIHTLFALLLLKAANGKNKAQINSLNKNISRDLIFYFEKDDSPIKSTILSICNNPHQWEKILTSDELNSKDTAIKILDILVERQKIENTQNLVKTPVTPGKVNQFITSFISGYEKHSGLRDLLSYFKVVKNVNMLSKSKSYWGFNQIQDKEAFIDTHHIDYGDIGEHYGSGLAESEDQIIFGHIRQNSVRLGSYNAISSAVKRAISMLESNNFKPSVIFTTFHLGQWRRAEFNKSEFTPSYEIKDSEFKNISDFVGVYKHNRRKIPIFRVWVKDLKHPEIIVSDIKEFITLHQYPPYSNNKEKNDIHTEKYIAFKITDLSADSNKKLRNKLISDNPKWLQQQPDKELYLKQKVILFVKEKFELKVKHKTAGVKMIFKAEDSD